jgi:hypothetical protein
VCHLGHVLVASAAHAQEHRVVSLPPAALIRYPGYRVRRLERWDDPLQAAQQLESPQRFVIGNGDIRGSSGCLQMRVLRPDPGVIEAGGYGMRWMDLSRFVL